jgi:hypothetical protein
MKASNEKRLAALNSAVGGGEAVILHMADGTVHQIRGDSKHFLKLAAQIDTGNPLGELAWIRDAARIVEPAHQFELLQALLQGPNREGEEDGPPNRNELQPQHER